MCTVTFIPSSEGFYFTSSRDEKASRVTIPPVKCNNNGVELIYPKDDLAGGTWIASSLTGRTACLLNGAFVNHQKRTDYVKSRGIILLESFNFQNTNQFSDKIDLINVEPFTLLTLNYSSGKLEEFFEFRWDGANKHLKQLNHDAYQIWSSATLYSPPIQQKRQQLFNQWVNKHQDFEDRMILEFHNRKHGLNNSDDILMKGDGDLMTLSISQLHVGNEGSHFNYFDVITDKDYKVLLTNKEFVNA
jgi:uncharacterized protein with NRDE domain